MNNQQYSAKHIRRMKIFERQHLKTIFLALQAQIKPVVSILRSKGVEAAINSLDTVEINSHLSGPIKDTYKDVGLYFANKTIHDINQSAKNAQYQLGVDAKGALAYGAYETKSGFGFNAEFLLEILNYFAQYLLNLAVLPISETTRQQILSILTQGQQQRWGVDKMANLLESDEFTLWRARLIVRTESNKAMNYGQRLGESKSEFESEKIWIAANDHRTRDSHRKVDDVAIDFKDRFHVPIYQQQGKIQLQLGIDLMTGPGDLHASAGNICNCRCTLAFRAKRDANGRLIRKASSSPVLVE